MFKSLTIAALAVCSVSAFSAVELHSRYLTTDCTFANGKVTRVVGVGKIVDGQRPLTMTSSYEASFTGLREVAEKAVAASTGRVNSEDDNYDVTIDGKRTEINGTDSKEGLYLVQMMVKACKL